MTQRPFTKKLLIKRKLLIVDDSEIVRDLTKGTLEDAGFEVATVESALGLSSAIIRGQPDLVLLDVAMPALSGDKAVEIIRKHRILQDCNVVLFSGRSPEELQELAKACGADGFIVKTEDEDELVREVKKWL